MAQRGAFVTNVFALLSEDGSADVKKLPKQPKPAPAKPKVKPAKPAEPKSSAPATQTPVKKSDSPAEGTRPRGENAGRGRGSGERGRGGGERGRGGAHSGDAGAPAPESHVSFAPAPEGAAAVPVGAEEVPQNASHDDKFRDRERHDREKMDQRGGRNDRGKRVYERRSGTGRGYENKKGGAGQGNWGTELDENVQTEGEASTERRPRRERKEDEALTEEEKKEQKEEEEKMGLDEYLKKVQDKLVKIPLPPPRKPGEGVEEAEQPKYVVHKSNKAETSGDQKKEKKEAKKSAAPQVALDSVFNVESPQAGRNNRKRNDYKGENKPMKKSEGQQVELALNDNRLFPSLGGKVTN